jgi:hypothetical protein
MKSVYGKLPLIPVVVMIISFLGYESASSLWKRRNLGSKITGLW